MSKAFLIAFAAVGAAILIALLKFGTIDPCGIVRAEVREEAGREGGLGVVASALPDGVIDSIIAAQYGALSPERCIAWAFAGAPPQAPAAPRVQPQTSAPVMPQPNQPNAAAALKQASAQANAAIMECRQKRLSGELKTYVASAECSNPRMIEAYRVAGYRYMDLVTLMAAKRLELAERVDKGLLTEAQEQLEYAQFMTLVIDKERQRDRGQ